MFCCGQEEVGWRDGNALTSAAKVPMSHDKFRWQPVAAEITSALSMIHSDGEILVHLEVEVRIVHAPVVAHFSDALAALHLLSLLHEDGLEVPVK